MSWPLHLWRTKVCESFWYVLWAYHFWSLIMPLLVLYCTLFMTKLNFGQCNMCIVFSDPVPYQYLVVSSLIEELHRWSELWEHNVCVCVLISGWEHFGVAISWSELPNRLCPLLRVLFFREIHLACCATSFPWLMVSITFGRYPRWTYLLIWHDWDISHAGLRLRKQRISFWHLIFTRVIWMYWSLFRRKLVIPGCRTITSYVCLPGSTLSTWVFLQRLFYIYLLVFLGDFCNLNNKRLLNNSSILNKTTSNSRQEPFSCTSLHILF